MTSELCAEKLYSNTVNKVKAQLTHVWRANFDNDLQKCVIGANALRNIDQFDTQ